MQLIMSDFIIDIVDKYTDYTNYITLTSFKNGKSSIFSSFDETLEEKEYGQFQLSFKVELFSHDTRNPYVQYLTHGRQLRLTLNSNDTILFNIISIKPTFGARGIEYTYECQDSFSYQGSKQSIDISFSTEDALLWDEIGPKTIYQLIDKLLIISHLHHQWSLDASSEASVIQFPDDLFQNKGSMKISINAQGTPYSILTQILGTFNATLLVNYVTNVISLQNKERLKYKGFMLNSGINLSNFSYAENSDDQCNILHVSGGEDAYGIPVSLLEPVPTELFELFINLDIENLQDIVIDKDDQKDYQKIISCYPDFYVKESHDNYVVYCKEYDEDTRQFKYVQDTVEFKNWRNAKSSLELKAILSSYYNRTKNRNVGINADQQQRMNIYTSYSKQFDSFANFFSNLEKIPHYGSFLANFDYGKDKNLSSARYNELQRSLNIDLRNTNILLAIYNNLYNEYQYQINKLENEEMEIINEIASILHNRASYAESDKPVSLYSYYVTQSVPHEGTDDDKNTQTDYYLPISEGKSSYGTTIYYDHFINIKCSTPSLSTIKNCFSKVYTRKSNVLLGDEGAEIPLSAIDTINNTITLSKMPDSFQETTLIYLKISSAETNEDKKTIKDCLLYENISQDTISSNEIDNLFFRLKHEIGNENYYNYQSKLYGSQGYDRKLTNINNQGNIKWSEYNIAINNMVVSFGKNGRQIDKNWLQKNNPYRFIVFSSLLDDINTYSLYVGGYGDRKNQEGDYYYYPGYLTLYRDYLLNEMEVPNTDPLLFSLQASVEKYDKEKTKWGDNFYRNYNDVIKEATFSDSNQLTNSGLYSAALKQFLTYNQPSKTYSASFLSSEDLQGLTTEVGVGDIVKLNQEYLKELTDPKTIVVEVESTFDTDTVIDTALVNYQMNHSVSYYEQNFGGIVRGMAYGNDYGVCVTDHGDIGVSPNKKEGKKVVSDAGIFTGICYGAYYDIFVAVTYNPNKSGVPATQIYHSKKPLNGGQTLAPKCHQIEGIVAYDDKCLYYGGSKATVASIVYDADYGSYAELTSSILLQSNDQTIKRIIGYEEGWLASTGNTILAGSDDTLAFTSVLKLDGDYDIRACMVYNNTLYIGGRNIGISYQYGVDPDPDTHSSLPSTGTTADETTEHDGLSYFVRDFAEVDGTLFALGYGTKNDGIKSSFVGLSRDSGRTGEDMDLDDSLLNPSTTGLGDIVVANEDNIVFASNKTVFDILYAPDTISPGKIKFLSKNKFELTVQAENFKYPDVSIRYIDYRGTKYSQQSLTKHILSISSKVKSEAIQMRINSVKKSLRSNTATLQVEENTLYKTLVDRLLYFLRYD